MNRDALLSLYRFHADANQIVLDTAAQLTEDAFTRESSPSHGSIRNLLIHILGGDIYFPAMSAGNQLDPSDAQALDELDSVDAIRARWDAATESALEFLESLDDDAMGREVTITFDENTFTLAVWQVFLQQIAHAHMHRGELSILLSQAGHPLPTIDLLVHFIKASGQHWPY
jgi:uncharacterized damage-inducible protein DinB